MLFSERYGYRPVRELIQAESMDDVLKNAIWSILDQSIWTKRYDFKHSGSYKDSNLKNLIVAYWFSFFKLPTDSIPYTTNSAISEIRNIFFKMPWHDVYSFIEITLDNYPSQFVDKKDIFIKKINLVLKSENSAYRVTNNEITPITSEQEIQSIEDAITNTTPYTGVHQHLNQSLTLLSDRQNPNYSKSMHDSISAVEGLARLLLEDNTITLGKAIPKLRTKYSLHPVLMESLNKLYGYTSDESGIRHGAAEASNLSYIDAKFMLVACTNFINYLIEKTKDRN